MNIKKLKEMIKDLPNNMEVIVIGEYGLGTYIEDKACGVEEKVYIEEGEIQEEETKILCLNIGNSLYEQ